MSTSSSSAIDWEELDRRVRPDFMAHVAQLRDSLSYPCVRAAYNHTVPQAMAYAEALLGCDPKHRYDAWLAELLAAYRKLAASGVTGYPDLVERIATRDGVAALLAQTAMPLAEFAGLVYLLRYWVIPQNHPARELVDPDDAEGRAHVRRLKESGIAGSLDLLAQGRTPADRRRIARELEIPEVFFSDLVHRADLRRLPYHSRKTIGYLMAAGAPTMEALAATEPQEMIDRVLAYGKTIGKDLRFGIEPGNSALIARVLPSMVEEV